ncbi:MAG: LON peptidase substrate-binding domain-containing protein [Myxococcales bacterium]|nr:LON peptidase substrate-binding domain-containing protein [Myxococcales bacterium]MDH5306236.1 LON peptidase substrate-binding domain-containing protein [Myxococcales bacterium]
MKPADTQLPLFALSNVVLFPRVKTPLHLFEPRYRQLARDALGGARRIGMVTVDPQHLDDISGDPPLCPIGCSGMVIEHQQLPDGRYNIVLLGEHRFRILEEVPRPEQRLYRVARVEILEDPYPIGDRERVARLRSNIVENVGVLVRRTQPDAPQALDPELFAGVDDETLVNTLANALALPPEEKQRLLEASSVPERFGLLAGALSFWRAELETGESGRSQPH